MLLEGAYYPRALVLPQYLHKSITYNINIEVPFPDSNQPFLQHASYLIYIYPFVQTKFLRCAKQAENAVHEPSKWLVLVFKQPLTQTMQCSVVASCFRAMKNNTSIPVEPFSHNSLSYNATCSPKQRTRYEKMKKLLSPEQDMKK